MVRLINRAGVSVLVDEEKAERLLAAGYVLADERPTAAPKRRRTRRAAGQ
ncbi:DUF7302 family protein [Nocardia sp. NPDC004711]